VNRDWLAEIHKRFRVAFTQTLPFRPRINGRARMARLQCRKTLTTRKDVNI